MFLLVSVFLSTGEVCLSACWDTTPKEGGTPPEGDPPRRRHPPKKEAPRGRHTPPPEGGLHPGGRSPGKEAPPRRHTVNERPVRILLECILVWLYLPFVSKGIWRQGSGLSVLQRYTAPPWTIFLCPVWARGAPINNLQAKQSVSGTENTARIMKFPQRSLFL